MRWCHATLDDDPVGNSACNRQHARTSGRDVDRHACAWWHEVELAEELDYVAGKSHFVPRQQDADELGSFVHGTRRPRLLQSKLVETGDPCTQPEHRPAAG